MGFAKYWEDDEEKRACALQDFDFGENSNVTSPYSLNSLYKTSCSTLNHKEYCEEISDDSFEIYVNNKKLLSREQSYDDIYTLSLAIPKSVDEVEISDDLGNSFTIKRHDDQRFYNISTQVLNSPFSKLDVKIPQTQEIYILTQKFNIQKISNADLYNRKYCSEKFDQYVSDDSLDEIGYLTYLKMLVLEKADTTSIVERACMSSFYKKLSPEFFWIHFLYTEYSSNEYLIESGLDENVILIFISILKGNFKKADSLLKLNTTKRQEILGCKILLGLLENDKLLVDYQKNNYKPEGYIGSLVSLLFAFQKNDTSKIQNDLYTLSIIRQYPLVKAVFALFGFENEQLTKELYPLVAKFDYKVPILYYGNVSTAKTRERILKNAMKVFTDSEELMKLSYSNSFKWIRKYIPCNSQLYFKELYAVNNSRKKTYNASFLNSIKFDEDIEITNLGKGNSISANCILISYKGYNILLDVGLDPYKPEASAYPFLDGVEKEIDYIVITHAHIDHCGGLPKAHAMWKNAKIIVTAPTKIIMKCLFDAEKIKNDNYAEFEITNIRLLEKDVVRDAIKHTIVTDYERWISISDKIKFRLHNAGHMIGAAMVELKINDKTILYTGDFTDFNQTLFAGADFSNIPRNIDLLISEATYVEKPDFDWPICCSDLKKQILKELKRKRTVLIPSAAVGRAQELVCILGEMSLKGELPSKTQLYLGGLAIPMSTRISPFFNKRYDSVLKQFDMLEKYDIPKENSVIIASSNFMSKSSASYKVLQNMCSNNAITILSNTAISKEAESLINSSPDVLVKSYSLPTHAGMRGIQSLITWIKPNFVSFIHCGGNIKKLKEKIIKSFDNDICVYESRENQPIRVFDLLNLMEDGLI